MVVCAVVCASLMGCKSETTSTAGAAKGDPDDPFVVTPPPVNNCDPSVAGCPCGPNGECFSTAAHMLACVDGICVIDTCPMGSLGCPCFGNDTCSPDGTFLLECFQGQCLPAPPKQPDCLGDYCPARRVVTVQNPKARACDVLFSDGKAEEVTVDFGDDVIGEFVWRRPRIGVAFIKDEDTPFEPISVVLNANDTNGQVEPLSVTCYDTLGWPLADDAAIVTIPIGLCDEDADCGDGDTCTVGVCLDLIKTCAFAPKPDGETCVDANACTTGETCQSGECIGKPLNCDAELADGSDNPCTTNSCHPAVGCIYPPNTIPCSDGNACTIGDQCHQSACVSGAAKVCNDGNDCTEDSCDTETGACVGTPLSGQACDDGSDCTSGDVCTAGVCAGIEEPCEDENPCMDAECDKLLGCISTPNQAVGVCDDGNPCTPIHKCVAGECVGVGQKDCNDQLDCTADSCVQETGECKNELVRRSLRSLPAGQHRGGVHRPAGWRRVPRWALPERDLRVRRVRREGLRLRRLGRLVRGVRRQVLRRRRVYRRGVCLHSDRGLPDRRRVLRRRGGGRRRVPQLPARRGPGGLDAARQPNRVR